MPLGANHNRTSQWTSAGTTTYSYDTAADVELTSKTDPSGKVTNYTYDANGNLTQAVYDPTGANQSTTYTYDSTNRLKGVTQPSGTSISFTYDADGNRTAKTVSSGSTTTVVNDVYQLGHLAYQTDGSGSVLATFAYDSQGVPTSVTVGSGTSAPRYYYVYNGHGDVIALVDATGTAVASYAYDTWGVVTVNTESFANGWHNPYLYDGKDGVRYDAETGLYWMSVRAYDPTLGRFISRDPLGRAPLMGWSTQPYAYAGNNPLLNVDPSGQRFATENDAQAHVAASYQKRVAARVHPKHPAGPAKQTAKKQTSQKAAQPKYHLAFRLALHITIAPNWLNADAVFDFLRAAGYAAGAAFAIVGGIGMLNAGLVLAGIAAIVQGADFLFHAITEMVRAVFGADSGAYGIVSALTVILDAVSAVFDLIALDSLGLGAVAAEAEAPLAAANARALAQVGAYVGIDIITLFSDLNAIVDRHMP